MPLMVGVKGATIRGNRLRANEYQCDRCGVIRVYCQSTVRPKPTTCKDCRSVLILTTGVA